MSSKGHGFKVLPLRFSAESTAHHDLFIKEHSIRTYDEAKPQGRTLFLINIPPYATEDALKQVFSSVGKIKSVTFQSTDSNTGFKAGYLVFDKHTALVSALKLNTLPPLSTAEHPIVTGLTQWIDDYNSSIKPREALDLEVKEFMRTFDKAEADKKVADKDGQVDEDGWTVVSKKGRKPGVARKKSVENRIIQKNRNKSKKKMLKNFYTFQLKEEKMKHIVALRKNFEESKEKVNAMKKMRNFKPLG